MPYGLVLERFYRVLFFDSEGAVMIDNWNDGNFKAYHYDYHPEWVAIWNARQSTDWRDYPLTYSGGFYAWEARLAFIDAAQQHRSVNGWSRDEERRAHQIVGVSAFRCPLAALRYGELAEGTAPPLIATFDGTFVWTLPEEKSGGVQALVVKPIGHPVAIGQFRSDLGIEPPHDTDPEQDLVPFDD